jgi:hypothetical protein
MLLEKLMQALSKLYCVTSIYNAMFFVKIIFECAHVGIEEGIYVFFCLFGELLFS